MEIFVAQGVEKTHLVKELRLGMTYFGQFDSMVDAVLSPIRRRKPNDPLTCIDLFCGIGGFHVAANNLGLKVVFASDIDDCACKTYYRNFGLYPEGDIVSIPAGDIPDLRSAHPAKEGGKMSICLTCEFARWKRTKSGALHPDKSGECQAHPIFTIPACGKLGSAVLLQNLISRADPMPDNCPLHKEAKL